jgi:hypothetical protein
MLDLLNNEVKKTFYYVIFLNDSGEMTFTMEI